MDIFKIGKVYRHKKFIDVIFMPAHIKKHIRSITCSGMWFAKNKNNFLAWDTITIKKKDIKNWEEV